MADWYGISRSNYFAVKNKKKFKDFCKKWNAELITKSNNKKLVGFISNDEFGALPSINLDEPNSVDNFDNFIVELSTHLKKDQVAIMMESGSEKVRYVTGSAIAVNHKGKTVSVGLNDIYKLAEKEFGITDFIFCEY